MGPCMFAFHIRNREPFGSLTRNALINTFHEHEAETGSPREATKFRPNFYQDMRKQPFVSGFPYISSLSYVARRGSYVDKQDFQSCVT